MEGTGSKNRSTSFKTKRAVLEHYESTRDIRTTIDHFFPDLTTKGVQNLKRSIYRWKRAQNQVIKMCTKRSTSNQFRSRKVGTRTTLPHEIESNLVEWINMMRKEGVPISSTMLKLEARRMAQDIGIEGFQGTWMWQKGFLKRHKFSIRARTREGQTTPPEADEASMAFSTRIKNIMSTLNISRVQYIMQIKLLYYMSMYPRQR